MKYFYTIIVLLISVAFIYPESVENNKVQYYDMSNYQILITPERYKMK